MQQVQSFLAVALLRLGFAGVSLVAACSGWLHERWGGWEPSEV